MQEKQLFELSLVFSQSHFPKVIFPGATSQVTIFQMATFQVAALKYAIDQAATSQRLG